MKKKRWTILLLMICVCSMLCISPVFAKAKPAPKKLTLSRKTVTLYIGESKPLFVEKVRPADASARVLWKVKNKRVAAVSLKGEVKAKKAGRTTVYAVSKRNKKVMESVRIVVKKRPEKVEKVCNVTGMSFRDDSTGRTVKWSLRNGRDEVGIIRNEEDFRELKRAINRSYRKYKNSCLVHYANTDFSKESIIVLDGTISGSLQFMSCTTRLDQDGALCGVVKVLWEKLIEQPGFEIPTMAIKNTIVLRMNKKDEAMIDYFKIEVVETEE